MSASAINAVCPLCGWQGPFPLDPYTAQSSLAYHIWRYHLPGYGHSCWCGASSMIWRHFNEHLLAEGIEAHCMDFLMGVRECKPGN